MNKRVQIIIVSVISFLFIASAVAGVLIQAHYADIDVMVNAGNFSVIDAGDGKHIAYIPYGVTPPAIDGNVDVVTVDTGNPSVIIETNERINIGNKNSEAEIILLNGGDTDYVNGHYKGLCQIKEFNDLNISSNKESYEITFQEIEGLLDMNPEKSWLLLSLDNDKSMLRTYAGLELSRLMDGKYTPDLRFVEVFVNGLYDGTYMLCEKVKISSNRLAISKASGDNFIGSGLTGGYLMMTDMSGDIKEELTEPIIGSNFYFSMSHANILPGATESSRIKFRHTKNLRKEHFDYIKQYMKSAEETLFSDEFNLPGDDGYMYYFDAVNIVDWYIVEEIFKNPNDPNCTSTYMYKEKEGKVSFGPVWYFGFSAGNSDFKSAVLEEGWYVRNNSWISRMFEDSTFNDFFKLRWSSIEDIVSNDLFLRIDERAEQLVKSAGFNGIDEENYRIEVKELKEWLTKRIDWINKQVI